MTLFRPPWFSAIQDPEDRGGTPTLDVAHGLVLVGTGLGVIYAVVIPF